MQDKTQKSKESREKKKLNIINFIVRVLQRETALFILPFSSFCVARFFIIFGHKTASNLFFSRSLLKSTLLMLKCDDERW